MGKPVTDSHTIPFQGGVDLVHEKALLPSGSFSQIQNMRPRRPGLEKRKGHIKQHSTAADSQETISLFNFSKAGQSEKAIFRQLADGSIQKATSNPPAVTTGNFGTEVLAARSSPSPASWGIIGDNLLLADNAGLPVIYSGATQKIAAFIVYKGTVTIPDIPIEGGDYTDDVTDGKSSTVAVLNSLDTLANFDCLFVMTPIRANKLNFIVVNANGTVSVATVKYRKNDGTWAAVSGFSDGTISSSASLGQTGSMTWTIPTDEIPHFQFNKSGFWYQISFSVALDSTVSLSEVSFEGPFQEIQNVWNGALDDAIEAQKFINSSGAYYTYSGSAMSAGGLTASDAIYFCSNDPLIGFFLDIGATPNTTASTAISSVSVWDGSAFTAVSGVSDGTKGGGSITGSTSGYVTWTNTITPKQVAFRSSIYGYWYKVVFSQTLSASLTWGIQTVPRFDITTIGIKAQSCAVWKDRAAYCFEDNYVHFSTKYAPMILNGSDYGLIAAGDGRKNKILAMRKYYNELFVWQEEKGRDGGCLTIIEGNSPSTFDKLVLSDRIGIVNSKSLALIEDMEVGDMSPNKGVYKGVLWISRYGIYKTDGRNIKNISGGISNYFDPLKAECIRAGYEAKHWMAWDSVYSVVRVGLVSGASATMPNIFFVYDPITGNWSTDTLGQPLSCIEEVEAASGNIPALQIGGGQDGYVYQVNTTDSDISTAIDGSVTMELNGKGRRITLKEEALRCKVQSAGDITRTIAMNGNTTFGDSKTFSMTAAASGDTYRRHRSVIDKTGDHVSIKWRNNTAGQNMLLLDVGVTINEIENNV